MANIKADYDPEIMAQLLAEPGVIEKVAQMTPDEQDLFKVLLVNAGTYKRYVYEQQKKQIREMAGEAFAGLRKMVKETEKLIRPDPEDKIKPRKNREGK